MSRFPSASSTKIYQIVFSLLLLGVMWSAVRSMMFGAKTSVRMLVAVIIGITFILALDKKYWILSAFLFGFYEKLPYIHFTGAELGSLILVSVCFVRRTMHRDVAVKGNMVLACAAIPFMLWMGVVWSQNPTGMQIFNSSAMGGRFYFKVILAFLSLCCFSTMGFGERDCRTLCLAVALGTVAFVLRSYWARGGIAVFGSDGAHYQFIRLSFIAPLFLARFTLPELLASRGPLIGFLCCFGLSVYSGNRTAGMRPVLAVVLSPIFLRRDLTKTIGLFLCLAMVLAVVVVGHGRTWRLPFSVQRALSFLPGKWDRRLESYGFKDQFRAELRYWAHQHIRASPWFGDGGFSLDSENLRWAIFSARGFDASIAGHVLSRNWHNVWLGMAADFGIPLSVAWGVFMAFLLASGYRGCMRMPPGSWNQTACLFFYFLIVIDTIGFHFGGGHTSLTAQQMFLWSGMMMAASNGSAVKTFSLEVAEAERVS